MLKNFGYMFVSNASRMLANALVFILLARQLSVSDFGQFMYCYTIAFFVQITVDYGFNLQLVKEVSQAPKSLEKIVNDCVAVKHLIALFAFLIATAIILALHLGMQNTLVSIGLVISTIMGSYARFYLLPYQGVGQFKIVGRLFQYYNLGFFLCVTLALFINHNLPSIMLGFIIGRLIPLLLIYFSTKAQYPQLRFAYFNTQVISSQFLSSLPYGLLMLFAVAYLYADTFFIEHYLGNYAVGIYQSGLRLVLAASFIADVFNSVYLPYLVKQQHQTSHIITVQNIVTRYVSLFSTLSLVILILLAKLFVTFLYGPKYLPVVPYFPLFGIILCLRYFGTTFGVLMTAFNKQNCRAWLFGSCFILNLICNALLVPKFGLWGALTASLLTLGFLNVSYLYVSYRLFHYNFVGPRLWLNSICCLGLVAGTLYGSLPWVYSLIMSIFALILLIKPGDFTLFKNRKFIYE